MEKKGNEEEKKEIKRDNKREKKSDVMVSRTIVAENNYVSHLSLTKTFLRC